MTDGCGAALVSDDMPASSASPSRAMSEEDCFFWRAANRAVLGLGLFALAMTSFGCFAAAVPIASGIIRAATSHSASSARTAKSNQSAQKAELCDMGGRPLPRLLELRTDEQGTTMYRPLNPGGPAIDPQPPQRAVGQVGGSSAWRHMGDLAGMHFQPSLRNQLAPSSVIFLAYAPVQVRGPLEQRELDALNHDFAPTSGLFDWDDRVFLYSAVHQLPCESSRAPAPMLTEPTRPDSPEQPEAPHTRR